MADGNRLDTALGASLWLAAQLPYVDAALERVWPRLAGTAELLARYARRGLFVPNDGGDGPRQVLHPLIRDFEGKLQQRPLGRRGRRRRRRAGAGHADLAPPGG